MATTTPAPSWPPTSGNLHSSGQSPFQACKSVWQTPEYLTLMRISVGFGVGTGMSLYSSGPPCVSKMTPFCIFGMVKVDWNLAALTACFLREEANMVGEGGNGGWCLFLQREMGKQTRPNRTPQRPGEDTASRREGTARWGVRGLSGIYIRQGGKGRRPESAVMPAAAGPAGQRVGQHQGVHTPGAPPGVQDGGCSPVGVAARADWPPDAPRPELAAALRQRPRRCCRTPSATAILALFAVRYGTLRYTLYRWLSVYSRM